MADWVIALEAPTGMERKLVRAYLEHNGQYRQIERSLRQEVDVEGYLEENFADVWQIADPLPEHDWISATEREAGALYREVARAAVQAARGQDATLGDVTSAMEDVIGASGKAGAFAKLKSMASSATSVQRDGFFLVCAFMVLGESAAD